MNILLTGGAGFIGYQWCRRLAAKGHKVVVLDNLSAGPKPKFPAGVRFIKGDILRPDDVSRAFEFGPFDRIDHLAAESSVPLSSKSPLSGFENNVLGTVYLLEACRLHHVPEFLFTSSSTVYGRAAVPTPEEAPFSPASNYGASKAAAECYVMSYARIYGFRARILRLANIIGPTATKGVMAELRAKLSKNRKMLKILGDGTQAKSFLPVEDALDLFEIVLEKSTESVGIYNIGSGKMTTIREIADAVCRDMDCHPVYAFSKTRGGWSGDVEEMNLSVKKVAELKKR